MIGDFNRQILDLEKRDDIIFEFKEITEWETTNPEAESENEYE